MRIYCLRKGTVLEVWIESESDGSFSHRTSIDFCNPQSAMEAVETLLRDLSYEYFEGMSSVRDLELRLEEALSASADVVSEAISKLDDILESIEDLNADHRQPGRELRSLYTTSGDGSGGGVVDS